MSVIELGVVTGDQPAPGRGRRPLRRGELRRIVAVAVAALCVLTVTGSARPRSHAPARLWTLPLPGPGSTYAVAEDGVYLIAVDGVNRLSRHDLRTGTTRWSTPVAETNGINSAVSPVLMLPAADTTVAVEGADGLQFSRQFSRGTTAVDTGTGRQLWRLPGDNTATHDGRALLAEWDDEGESLRTLRVVGLRDGNTLWSRPGGGISTWTTGGAPGAERLISAASGGTVEVRDFATGRLIGDRRLPGSADPDFLTDLIADGDTLYIRTAVRGRATMTAYDLETLRERWQLTSDDFSGFYRCGPVMCLNDTDGIAGHDRVTGERLWQRADGGYAFALDDGRLVVDDDAQGTRHSVIDGRTGRVLAELGTGRLVRNYPEGGDRIYVLTRTAEPAGLTAVSELDDRTGEVRPRGIVPPLLDYGCQAVRELLVCTTSDSQLTAIDLHLRPG